MISVIVLAPAVPWLCKDLNGVTTGLVGGLRKNQNPSTQQDLVSVARGPSMVITTSLQHCKNLAGGFSGPMRQWHDVPAYQNDICVYIHIYVYAYLYLYRTTHM